MIEYVPDDQAVNQLYKTAILINEEIGKEENNGFVEEQLMDFASGQLESSQRPHCEQFLAGKYTLMVEHPPYSPHLAACNFNLLLKVTNALTGTYFLSMEKVKS